MEQHISLKIIFPALLISFLLSTGVQAQSALLSAGGNNPGSGGSVSYSLGQTLYTTNTGGGYSIAKGVQQAVLSCAATNWYADNDGDGDGAGDAILACIQPINTSSTNVDCDDASSAVHPGVAEMCNGIDDNCDLSIDEGIPSTTYYQDADHDGKGNFAVSVISCSQPAGYVTNSTDCDDNSIVACPKPSGMISSDITDVSATVSWGYLPCATRYRLEYRRKTPPISAWTVVYPTTPSFDIAGLTGPNILYQWRVATICSPGGTSAESGYATIQSFYTRYRVYTDADLDVFGDDNSPTLFVSAFPQAGYSSNSTDCDDASNTTFPGAPELCNGADDDCDLVVDEGVNWYQDEDGDGLGNAVVAQNSCEQPSGYVSNSLDCNDNNGAPICSSPVNVMVNSIGTTFATVAWTGSSCASSYTVMYHIYPGGAWSTQLNTTGTSRTLSGLLPGTSYQVRVRSKCPSPNPAATSAWVYITFTTQTVPMGLTENESQESNSADIASIQTYIYPNPAKNFIILNIDTETPLPVSFILYDMQGKILLEQMVKGVNTRIEMKDLVNGTYFIKVFNDKEELKTFKVIKI
jgi:hypothetical protein